jgi:hypothetical protein
VASGFNHPCISVQDVSFDGPEVGSPQIDMNSRHAIYRNPFKELSKRHYRQNQKDNQILFWSQNDGNDTKAQPSDSRMGELPSSCMLQENIQVMAPGYPVSADICFSGYLSKYITTH